MLPHLQEKELAPCMVLVRSSPRTTGIPKSEELSWAHGGSEKRVQLLSWRLLGIYLGLIKKAQDLSLLTAHFGGL